MSRFGPIVLGICGVAIFLAAWQIAAVVGQSISPATARFLPSPLSVVETAERMFTDSGFWVNFFFTNARVVVGFLCAAAVGIPLALALAHWRLLDGLFSPVLDFARYVPVPALVPLSIVWFGIGESQKIAILFIGTLFQLFVLVIDAVRRVPTSHVDSALTLGLNRRQLVLSVLLPASAPQIFDACRVCVGLTWSYVMVAELVASEHGIGYGIVRAQRFLLTDQIVVLVIILGLTGILYDRAFVMTRKRWFLWEDRPE